MNSWTGDTSDMDDEEEDNEEQETSFAKELEKAVRGPGNPNDIGELEYVSNLDQTDDEDLLREAWLQLDGEKANLVKNRIEEIGGDVPSEDGPDEPESSSGNGGWGGSDESDDEELPEDMKKQQTLSDTESESAEPAVESAEDIEDEDAGGTQEIESDGADSVSEQSGGPPVPESSVSPSEAAEWERRWKIMVWGPPKLFKTHFSFTAPEPIAFIDCEGKADDIAAKFTDKEIQIWQPKRMEAEPDTRFRRAKKALNEAIEWLEWWWENEDERGTIVVDSMTLMWDWAQIHHKKENYTMKDPEEIELSANFKSSQESDWAVVKEYHNGEFRDLITDSPFHFVWTAMERQDIQRQIDEDTNVQLYEPKGEPDNTYKADTVLHAREDEDRGKVGDLTGSNFTDHKFVGLKKPTFPKLQTAVEEIATAEASDEDVDVEQLKQKIGIEAIIDYDPQMYGQ